MLKILSVFRFFDFLKNKNFKILKIKKYIDYRTSFEYLSNFLLVFRCDAKLSYCHFR